MRFVAGSPWPQEVGKDQRISDYDEFAALFNGDHEKIWPSWKDRLTTDLDAQKELTYVMTGLPKIVPKVYADLLVGEPPKVRAANEDEQTKLDEIIQRNHLWPLTHTNVVMGAVRGDSLFKLRQAPNRGPVKIVNQPAQFWFPETAPNDVTEIVAHNLAWTVKVGKDEYLQVERHTAGLIENFAFKIKDGKLQQADIKEIGLQEKDAEIKTLLPVPLVFHIPNEPVDNSTFGVSDLAGWESLVGELNDLFSQTGRTIKKHTVPSMYGPDLEGVADDEGNVSAGDGYIPVQEGQTVPGYLVWDPNAQIIADHYGRLLEQVEIVTEVGPLLRMNKDGAGDSGTALRRRLTRPLAKTARKRSLYDPTLKDLLYYALWLETGVQPSGRPEIEWQDGLPDDPVEQAQIEATRTGNKPTTSQLSAIKRLDGVDDKAAEAEMDRIREEVKEAAPMEPEVTFTDTEGDGTGGGE